MRPAAMQESAASLPLHSEPSRLHVPVPSDHPGGSAQDCEVVLQRPRVAAMLNADLTMSRMRVVHREKGHSRFAGRTRSVKLKQAARSALLDRGSWGRCEARSLSFGPDLRQVVLFWLFRSRDIVLYGAIWIAQVHVAIEVGKHNDVQGGSTQYGYA